MKIVADGWLAEIMRRPALRVDVEGGVAPFDAERGAFYYAKVPCAQVADVAALCAHGFTPVDVNVLFSRTTEPAAAVAARDGLVIRACTEADHDGVLDVAGSCYRFSRFHLDPKVPVEVAHTIKREWARNYVKGARGDRLFTAVLDGHVVGFLAALKNDAGATIDLVGVSPAHQQQGIGAALVAAFIEHYRGAVPRLHVGTQAANVPSVRMYERLGFRLAHSSYVLHLHA